MVAELHKRGYQHLRIVTGFSASGVHWRCEITPRSNVTGKYGLTIVQDGPLVARYSSADEDAYFQWHDARGATARELADLFVVRFPELCAEALHPDLLYAGRYVQMLGVAEQGLLPWSYSDYGADFDEFLPLTTVGRAATQSPRLPVPPFESPGDAPVDHPY